LPAGRYSRTLFAAYACAFALGDPVSGEARFNTANPTPERNSHFSSRFQAPRLSQARVGLASFVAEFGVKRSRERSRPVPCTMLLQA
jgi:hypothetical protein